MGNKPYSTPLLQVHGSVEQITLQGQGGVGGPPGSNPSTGGGPPGQCSQVGNPSNNPQLCTDPRGGGLH